MSGAGAEDPPLDQKVVRWLADQGYPLEMKTAREFRRAGAAVDVGRFYTDPDSGEPREIDVVATFGDPAPSHDGHVSVAISFVCECKASTDPWVMMTTEASAFDLPVAGRVFHSRWGDRVQDLGRWIPTRDSIDLVGFAAYNGVRALCKGGTGGDPVYKAIHSATKAAYAYARETNGSTPTLLQVAFPVIVVDAPLFSCSLPKDSDELDVKRVAVGVPLRWSRPLGGRSVTIVDVVVAKELGRYVADSAAMAEDLRRELAQE